MKKTNAFAAVAVSVLASAALAAPAAFAQESDAGFGDMFAAEGSEGGSASALAIDGSMDFSARAFLGPDDRDALFDASDAADRAEKNVVAKLGFSYAGAASEFDLKVKLDPATIKDHPEDVLEEATARAFLGDFVLEAGKTKLVWGKGDALHVADLFNANDFADLIFPEYVDRRLAEVMARAVWTPSTLPMKLEGVWTPFMTADRVPTSGPWVPAQVIALKSAAEGYVASLYAAEYSAAYKAALTRALAAGMDPVSAQVAASAAASAAGTVFLASHSDASAFLPATKSLDYGQYGLRATGTVGPVDLGASYYYGRFKTPSVFATVGAGGKATSLSVAYDRLQAFSLEAAYALGPLNLRGEASYYLTDDIEGDDPALKNNSANWLFGFDVGLPFNNLDLNVQTVGSYKLGGDGIKSPLDVDYDSEDLRSDNRIVLKLSDSWAHEKIKPAVKAVWGVERNEFLVMPELAWKVRDDFVATVSGALFLGNEDGTFGPYADNDFLKVAVAYKF